ncbi:MAG: hypothetical protein RLZZ387_2601 [Chloroflexota bacterium]|jgi:hypothetical protein
MDEDLNSVFALQTDALQFDGPSTNHCFGIPYVSFGLLGVLDEGDTVPSAKGHAEAVRLFMAGLEGYVEDAEQIAWRMRPYMRRTEDGRWAIKCRLAVFPNEATKETPDAGTD